MGSLEPMWFMATVIWRRQRLSRSIKARPKRRARSFSNSCLAASRRAASASEEFDAKDETSRILHFQ